ncbi:hypothetical protein ACZ90_02510 [Streptomyces albus subsp. albus]|uniref:hypothetical protein n=1 Tax=Streptomycetaceae TaxID=2062 RepID=UPI0004BDE88C|nr:MULTISPECIES: hypothetical protein [Streptomycetaceae]KOG84454.1 hypothetical protein ADK33_03340 [Streptomyces griseus subsp. rhodochrous]KUJ70579.1 hypothetical protein ACZ90_02510 [Streptomyces albus subsp. albus]
MGDTFGGEHRRPDHSGIGHTQWELQDRASYDCDRPAGVSCALIAVALIAGLAGLIAAFAGAGGIA